MSPAPNDSQAGRLGRDDIRELHRLCSQLYDGVIAAEEMTRFDQWIRVNAEARTLYLRYVALHNGLLTVTGKHHCSEAELLRTHVTAVELREPPHANGPSGRSTPAELETRQHSPPTRLPTSWIVAATLLLVATLGFFRAARTPVDQAAIPPRQAPAGTVPAATLTIVSPSVMWQPPGPHLARGDSVHAGELLELAAGEVELTYGTGTKLTLVGPAEFLVETTGGKLLRGGLVASVTEAGHGFTIETPNGKVVDLGTEFGVAVDDFGVCEVNVFAGKVEAFPNGERPDNGKVELATGDGLQWNQREVVPLVADLRRFTSSILPRTPFRDEALHNRSLVDLFRAASLDSRKWKSLGTVRTSPDGLRLLPGADPGAPYLITADPLDPALGTITVTCDLRFAGDEPDAAACFSILTRSADTRGIALPPWHGTLASCARCTFCSDADSGNGLLRAGVKLESDRELTSITWSGFAAPVQDTTYRVVMRDDGVNVSFTVSQRDKPSVSKTVSFRSLFRGRANFVALEGSRTGETLIERLEISQDVFNTPLASYGDFSSLVFHDHAEHTRQLRLLAELAPGDAKLVLADDFEQPILDDAKWITLGEVSVANGSVQLGQPNADAHIDTWKLRPYLLTRMPLDPREGTLTIVGRVGFADNFLSGYGASFAVITRADNRHGSGPGWENSILQRGVRANFWPASWDAEHSLEIHEKPGPDALTLLATRGVKVNPNARSYLFRVVDDGHETALTIIDPNRPDVAMQVSSADTTVQNRGCVAFESCWGSPVTLDDVRIYQATSSGQTNHPPE